MNILFNVKVFTTLILLAGCSAGTKIIKNSSLETETRMSTSIFLDPIPENKKTVLLQVRNTSDKSGLDIESKIASELTSKGYRVVHEQSNANLMIQINILQVGKVTQGDPFSPLGGGFGSAVSGFAVGAAISGATGGSGKNMVGVGLLVGAASYVADAMVDVIVYSMITDVQVSEKINGENWKRYQTRVISTAKKVNLKFETAEPALSEGLVKSISNIL